jgi:CHAT domain-containing protein
MVWLVLLLAMMAGCRRQPSPEELYQQAFTDYRHGDLKRAADAIAEHRPRASNPASEVYWKWRFLEAEVALARGRVTAALELLSQPAPESFTELAIRRHADRCAALTAQRRYPEARAELNAARKLVGATTPAELVLEADIREAVLLARTREFEAADAVLRRVVSAATASNLHYYRAAAFINLAYSTFGRDRFDAAAEYGEQAVAAAEKAEAKRLLAGASVNLGASYTRLGEFERARTHLDKAVAILREIDDRDTLHNTLAELGNVYTLQNDPSKAVVAYREAYEVAKGLERPDAAKWAGNLATVLTDLGQLEEAEHWNNIAVELSTQAKDVRSLVFLQANRAAILEARGSHQDAIAEYRAALNRSTEYPELRWSIHAGLATLFANRKEFASANREFESALLLIEKKQAELSRNQFQFTFLARLIRFYQEYVDALVEQADYRRALRIAERSRARILAERLGRHKTAAAIELNPETIAARTGMTVLSYWLAPKRSLLWVVTRSGMQMEVLPPQAKIDQLVATYREVIEESLRPRLDNTAGKQLFEILIAPASKYIGSDGRVLVVPDGSLHRLNLETLPVPGDRPHYWIDDVTLSVAPSMTVLDFGAARERSRQVLLIGAAEAAGPKYPALPQADEEIDSIAARFAATRPVIYKGAQAVPAAYLRSDPERFTLIHFAAHAEANPESPLDSAVVLSRAGGDFKLYARDVIDTPLAANLVTISGCRSAGARSYSGEGMIGFAWAFLTAGAKTVIAGLWDVSDSSTAAVMKDVYENIARGKPAAEALRAAKLNLIRSGGTWSRPFYWAPFQTYVRSFPAR